MSKIKTLNILDAFSGSGNWVFPWGKSVSYNIHIDSIDDCSGDYQLKKKEHINLKIDIRDFKPNKEYHIVYASFPCTHFSKLMITQRESTPEEMKEAVELADIAFKLASKAKWCYVIENPATGKAVKLYPLCPFDNTPYKKVDYSEYDYPMKKHTAIWSNLPLILKQKSKLKYNDTNLCKLGKIGKSAIPIELAEYVKRIIVRTYNKELQEFKKEGF